jgi:hypothetical protein
LRNTTPLLLVFALCLTPSLAQNAGNPARAAAKAQADAGEVKDTYHVVQVDQFQIQQGVEFPAEILGSLQEEITRQLAEANVFQEVFPAGQNRANSKEPVLRLSGTITHYKKGSRAKRYIVPGGIAGVTEIDALVFFRDGATGQRLMSEDLRAVLSGGVFGGSESNATQEFARQIIIKTKLMTVKQVPAAEALTADTEGAGSPPASERHVVAISQKDWSGSQRKLDEEAGAGYRVVGLSLTGYQTADVELERSATQSVVYQYRLLHPVRASNLQKDIKKATDDGFRVSAHTLTTLGGYTTLIMEQPPVPAKTRYLYLVNETRRISSAQKDAEKYQSDGYTLVEETEHNGLHLLLFEKAVEGEK